MTGMKAAALTAVLALSATAAAAQAPPAPLPPIVQKFVASVGRARTLSVEMTQATRFLPLRKAPVVTKAEFSLEKPNKFAVTWTAGSTPITAAASDGVTLSEWDSRTDERQPAPDRMGSMLAPLRRGLLLGRTDAAAANMAFVLFTHPDALAALPDLQDSGAEQVNGVQTRKVTARTPQGSADFWFAADTGLPVQAVVSDTSNTYTVRFLEYQIDKPIADTVFAAAPSGPLTGALTEHSALHSLKTGTPAPDFTLQTPEGKPVTLSGLKGRVVLLAFCPPYLPGNFTDTALLLIRKARTDLPAKDLSVLWIVETDHPERAAAFAQAHSTDALTVLLDPPGPAAVEHKLYHIPATPTFYVISRNGDVEAAFVGSLPEKQAIVQADIRAAAVSALLHGGVQHTDLSEYDHAEDMMDEASLEAALTAAGLGQVRKN